ncbi:uncharacterized protein LOC144629350 [Oculina patagonica]
MHLWEFLLELLHDKDCRPLISWTRKERGEFRIIETEEVARLWGFEHGRQGMTYDKLSRALRQYYNEGFVRKVKGQRTTYRFDNLPYDYYPGITRRRRKTPLGRRISTYQEHGMGHGNYIFRDDPKRGATMLWSNLHGRRNTDLDHSKLPIWRPYYPNSTKEAKEASNLRVHSCNSYDGVRHSDDLEHQPINPPSSLQSSCPQTTTQIWFPEKARAKYNAQGRRNADNWGIIPSATPKLSSSSSPLQAVEQNVSRNVRLPDTTYAGIFLTPESSPSSSPLSVREKCVSRSDSPSAGTFACVTPESCNSCSPLHVVEPHVSRNVTPPGMAHPPVRVPNSVVWPTPVYPRVNTVPYLPLMYVVPVPYEPHPVITGVTGNYQGHPPHPY